MRDILHTILVFTLACWSGIAQDAITVPVKYTASNKGKLYVYWGGNRGYFH